MPVCDVYQLQAFVDGQLCEAEASVVAEHLTRCAPCARLLQGLACVTPLQVSPETAPAGLHERLLAAVAGLRPLEALDCGAALEFASGHLDGELSVADCQRLNAHLDACAACALVVAEMGLTSDLLRSLEPETAPAGLLQRIQLATGAWDSVRAAASVRASHQPAPRPAVWQVWARNAAGFAAAAAVLFALLTHLPQAPAPLVTRTPAAESALSVVAAKPAIRPEPVAVPATSARSLSLESLRRTALSMTSPMASRRPLSSRTVVAATAPEAHPAPEVRARVPFHGATPASVVAPSPPLAVESRPVPVMIAVAPTRPVEAVTPHEFAVTPSVRVDTPAPAVPASPVSPAPVRVAVLETPRATTEGAGSPPVAASPKPVRRPSWVSRASAEEREVYSADRDVTRLAEARRDLNADSRTIRQSEVRGFVIH